MLKKQIEKLETVSASQEEIIENQKTIIDSQNSLLSEADLLTRFAV